MESPDYREVMYIPRAFELTDREIAEALGSARLAHLVTPGGDGLSITPLPMLYDPERNRLLAHVARANPHWRAAAANIESVAIFSGIDGYISPSLYATKSTTGKVVPTWNYETINVYGHLHIHDDSEWLLGHVHTLTDDNEHHRHRPWSVDDAPTSFVAGQLKAIVGVELTITRWEGKAKMSQNQPARNQQSVIAGLRAGGPNDRRIADAVATYSAGE